MSPNQQFLLQRVQPALTGLIDGSLLTIAPIFPGALPAGILHPRPFLIPTSHLALVLAACVVGFELIAPAWLRWGFFQTSFVGSLAYVTLARLVIARLATGL